jgi:hypothetical protein
LVDPLLEIEEDEEESGSGKEGKGPSLLSSEG